MNMYAIQSDCFFWPFSKGTLAPLYFVFNTVELTQVSAYVFDAVFQVMLNSKRYRGCNNFFIWVDTRTESKTEE